MADRQVETMLAAEAEAAVLRDLEADRLELPALPTVAVRIFDVLRDPDFEVDEVAKLIESDPLLAAQLVRLANSAAFASRQSTASIRDCVTRIGRLQLRMFLFEVSARTVLESRDPRIAELCRGLWEHSQAVAWLSREIAATADPQQAEGAYLAGLLHDVGKPLLAALLVSAEQRLLGERTTSWFAPKKWLAFIKFKHRRVGVALARSWGLPEAVSRSIDEATDYDAEDPRCLANAVRLANALAKLAGLYVGSFDPDEVQASAFVGRQLFGLDDRAGEALVKRAQEQIQGRASPAA